MIKIIDVVRRAFDIAHKAAQDLALEIVDVEWVSEHGTKILRIIADSPTGMSIDEATNLNEAISLI